jgi:hypothetical protein
MKRQEKSIGGAILASIMGLIDLIKRLFPGSSEEVLIIEPEEEIYQEEYASQYQGKTEQIATEALDALLSKQEKNDNSQSNPIIISEYDAGDVEFDELSNDELIDNSNMNVVEYESLDKIVEYLDDVEIIGDISTEVSFDSQ